MNSHQVKNGRVTVASATVAHVLGWAAFLWIVLRADFDQDVSFSEFNGYWPVLALFVPVGRDRAGIDVPVDPEGTASGECTGSLGPLGHPVSVLRLGLSVVRYIEPAGGHSFDSNRRCLWAWARIALAE